jgi:dihydrofolate synthase/folylpolyglutamate synthase
MQKAEQEQAPIIFAEENSLVESATSTTEGYTYETTIFGTIKGELGGDYQVKNANTILNALVRLIGLGYNITEESIRKGFSSVCATTGLMGRWQRLGTQPKTVCDAGHNIGGIKYIVSQLKREKYNTLRIVFGMVNDKEIDEVLAMMPKEATYYFTQASIRRALPAMEMKEKAATHGLSGTPHPTVSEALQAAQADASPDDFIFIGGSCFVVADLLQEISK